MAGMAECQLLLGRTRVSTSGAELRLIRGLRADGIDWTVFTRQAMNHGLASLVGQTLARVAPDAVPEELLDAFRIMVDQTRRRNVVLFEELGEILAGLSRRGV